MSEGKSCRHDTHIYCYRLWISLIMG